MTSYHEIPTSSWEDFDIKRKEILDRDPDIGTDFRKVTLYRGQADSRWELISTLERIDPHKTNSLDIEHYMSCVFRIKSHIERHAKRVWSFNIQEIRDISNNRDQFEMCWSRTINFAYLTHLRHISFPSPLVDWSKSPYIAAFFAFSELKKIEVDNEECISIYMLQFDYGHHELRAHSKPKIIHVGPYVAEPDVPHDRHLDQQSQYTFCISSVDSLNGNLKFHNHIEAIKAQNHFTVYKFFVPKIEKIKVLRNLAEYNLNSYSLYGSEESLAKSLSFSAYHNDFIR